MLDKQGRANPGSIGCSCPTNADDCIIQLGGGVALGTGRRGLEN